jgi:hypothetical protein
MIDQPSGASEDKTRVGFQFWAQAFDDESGKGVSTDATFRIYPDLYLE